MTPLTTYLGYLWREVEGPRLMILLTSGAAGLASGIGIAAINAGIESWAMGEVPWQPIAMFIGTQVIWLITVYYAQLRSSLSVNKFIYDKRTEAVKRVVQTDLSQVETLTLGKILAVLQHDTQTMGGSMSQIVTAVRGAVTVTFSMVYLAILSPVVAALAIIAIIVGVSAYYYQESRVRVLAQESRRRGAEFNDAMHDLVLGAKESRFHISGETSHLRQIDRLGVGGRVLTARTELLSFVSGSVTHLVLIGLLGLVAFLPPETIAVTGVPVFQAITVMLYLVNGIESMVSSAAPITRGRVSHYEFTRVWDLLVPETRRLSGAKKQRNLTLEARGLTYEYATDDGPFRLGPIDLSFEAPELVFITGGNGSGKTTLLKCLTGLYPAHGGELLFNGAPVTHETLADLRSSAAAVFHDYHLFSKLYGHDLNHRRALITDMIDSFGLSEKVQLGPRGFTTTQLSTGQRKRLGLITALLLDRPIIVLDEFGAEQDPQFRDRFYRQILPALRDEGRLILAVTHDDRYFEACDRRIHLDYGQISEITRGGNLRKMVNESEFQQATGTDGGDGG